MIDVKDEEIPTSLPDNLVAKTVTVTKNVDNAELVSKHSEKKFDFLIPYHVKDTEPFFDDIRITWKYSPRTS